MILYTKHLAKYSEANGYFLFIMNGFLFEFAQTTRFSGIYGSEDAWTVDLGLLNAAYSIDFKINKNEK